MESTSIWGLSARSRVVQCPLTRQVTDYTATRNQLHGHYKSVGVLEQVAKRRFTPDFGAFWFVGRGSRAQTTMPIW